LPLTWSGGLHHYPIRRRWLFGRRHISTAPIVRQGVSGRGKQTQTTRVPTYPGYGATKDAKRYDKDNPQITRSCHAISYGDASAASAIGGQAVLALARWPSDHLSRWTRSPKVHLKSLRIGTSSHLRRDCTHSRSAFPDQWIIRASHDAWSRAEDPISGQLLCLKRRAPWGLVKQGWKPRAQLSLRVDGESRPAWLDRMGGDHQDELRKKAVMYVNSDTRARLLGIEGSHTLSISSWRCTDVMTETNLTVWSEPNCT